MLLKLDDQFLAQFMPYFIGMSQSHGLIYFVICIYFMFYTQVPFSAKYPIFCT